MPMGSAELSGAFGPGRQGCHYPPSGSCTRRRHCLWILTPSAPPVRAEGHKPPRSRAKLLSEGQEKEEDKSFARVLRSPQLPSVPKLAVLACISQTLWSGMALCSCGGGEVPAQE